MTEPGADAMTGIAEQDTGLQVTHFALLVPDMSRAVALYTDLFGISFCDRHVAPFARVDHYGMSASADVPMTYSMDGAPYVEILEATGDGLWSTDRGLGMHHVGGYATDFAATVARFEARGLRREATVFTAASEPIIAFFAPAAPSGVRVEVLSSLLRPSWADWVSGGPPPGHGEPTDHGDQP